MPRFCPSCLFRDREIQSPALSERTPFRAHSRCGRRRRRVVPRHRRRRNCSRKPARNAGHALVAAGEHRRESTGLRPGRTPCRWPASAPRLRPRTGRPRAPARRSLPGKAGSPAAPRRTAPAPDKSRRAVHLQRCAPARQSAAERRDQQPDNRARVPAGARKRVAPDRDLLRRDLRAAPKNAPPAVA